MSTPKKKGKKINIPRKVTPKRKKIRPCPFRLWASWMSSERSFQIKSLIPTHSCVRNFDLSPLVSFKWIAKHFATEIVSNPKMTYRQLRDEIKKHFLISVSIGQCKRAKQRALFDHEGGLKEHYARLWDYKAAILKSNPGSNVKIDVDEKGGGEAYFKRIYICFKGLADGWNGNCRRVIGLDGCFLKSTVKGELLTAMGRDANNQMYPIAWAVVNVENRDNWCWFLAALAEDLHLYSGAYLTVISDGHKGLIDAVATWLPNAEHRMCTRHIYQNFKKKWSGLTFRSLFWGAAASVVEERFEAKMEQIKALDEAAYNYLIEKNPNSWCRAFFQMDRSCAAYENGISESYHRTIIDARHKPIITMLEDIRVYLMQRVVDMSKKAKGDMDEVCPSIRKYLEAQKIVQREWTVYASSYQLFEVRNANDSFSINLDNRTCSCRMWDLSGIPCTHAVAAYVYCKRDPEDGVNPWYTKGCWMNTYSSGIRPVPGTSMWGHLKEITIVPPMVRRMPGRPKKKRIRHPTENDYEVSRVGRQMTCSNCSEKGHNKTTCKKPRGGGGGATMTEPESSQVTGVESESAQNEAGGGDKCEGASGVKRGSRGGGRGSRGGGRGSRSGGTDQMDVDEPLTQSSQVCNEGGSK